MNERLQENLLQLEITVYGGSIMTMVYDNRPATRDINCVFSEVNQSCLITYLICKFAFNLSEVWINEEIKEPLKSILKKDDENNGNHTETAKRLGIRRTTLWRLLQK